MQNTSEQEFSWKITAHDIPERTPLFYVTVFGVTILLLAFCLWQRNFLFGMFVLMATGTILFLSTQHDEEHEFALTEDSLIIGDGQSEYPYKQLSHYDMHEFAPNDNELFIAFRGRVSPILRVRFHSQDREIIQGILNQHIKRKAIEPTLLDIISKMIGI